MIWWAVLLEVHQLEEEVSMVKGAQEEALNYRFGNLKEDVSFYFDTLELRWQGGGWHCHLMARGTNLSFLVSAWVSLRVLRLPPTV